MPDSLKPLPVEIGKPPLELRNLVSLLTADAYAVVRTLEQFKAAGSDKHRNRENELWDSILKFEPTSLRVLQEVIDGIECGHHKVVEPELHALRQTISRIRMITVDGLRERRGGGITKDRLHLILCQPPAELTELWRQLERISGTLPEDLVIDALTRRVQHTAGANHESQGLVRLIRDIRDEFRSVHLTKADVRIRLIQYPDDLAGEEHAEDALPTSCLWLGKQRAGKHKASHTTRTIVLWTKNSEADVFYETTTSLRNIAKRAGAITRSLNFLPEGWTFSDDQECWWTSVFEAAWSGVHPTLQTSKQVWINAPGSGMGFVTAPYDIDQLRAFVARNCQWGKIVPPYMLEKLPDAFLSELDSVAWASMALCDLLEDVVVHRSQNGKVGDTTPVSLQPETSQDEPEPNPLDRLQPAHRDAYLSYGRAVEHLQSECTDRDAYDWLKEHDPATDYTLPAFESWQRYLRKARQAQNEQKKQRRLTTKSKSVARSKDL